MIPTIAEAAKRIAAKELSPVELTKDRLAKAQAVNAEIHAFIRFTPEIALEQAKAAEARQMAGTLKGPLDGIPIGHKDIYETAGVPTTGHSRVLEHHVPKHDSAAVRAWADAGAVMLGKLATHEFAWGGPSFDLPWPPARNPWDTARFTSGSSSGTGAAVAAGVILGGTGSDTSADAAEDTGLPAPRRRGPIGGFASMYGLTMTNPATILSFGALFASIGAGTGGAGGAFAVVLGVFTGSIAWWALLTGLVAVMRARLTPRIVTALNVASAVLIGGFGLVAIALGVAG